MHLLLGSLLDDKGKRSFRPDSANAFDMDLDSDFAKGLDSSKLKESHKQSWKKFKRSMEKVGSRPSRATPNGEPMESIKTLDKAADKKDQSKKKKNESKKAAKKKNGKKKKNSKKVVKKKAKIQPDINGKGDDDYELADNEELFNPEPIGSPIAQNTDDNFLGVVPAHGHSNRSVEEWILKLTQNSSRNLLSEFLNEYAKNEISEEDFLTVIEAMLAATNLSVRENAVLALGVSQSEINFLYLASLYESDSESEIAKSASNMMIRYKNIGALSILANIAGSSEESLHARFIAIDYIYQLSKQPVTVSPTSGEGEVSGQETQRIAFAEQNPSLFIQILPQLRQALQTASDYRLSQRIGESVDWIASLSTDPLSTAAKYRISKIQ